MMRLLTVFPLFLVVLTGCSLSEYQVHRAMGERAQNSSVSGSVQGLSGTVAEVLITPSKVTKARILDDIAWATGSIRIEVYILTDKEIIAALGAAQKRWVDVRVLLDPHPFGSPRMNDDAEKQLIAAGISVKRTSEQTYVFTHAKFLIIDDTLYLSTGNFSHSSFTTNREVIVRTEDTSIVSDFKALWEADFEHKKYVFSDERIFLSPVSARTYWKYALTSADREIIGWMQSFSDKDLSEIILSENRTGTEVDLCMGNEKKAAQNSDDIIRFRSSGVDIATPKSPYTHAKALFVDGETLVVASTNFTANSLDNNREVGIVLTNSGMVTGWDELYGLAQRECENSTGAEPSQR